MGWVEGIPQWGWFVLEVVVAPAMGLVLENRFGILKRSKKVYHKILNSPAQLLINLVFESQIRFSDIKKIFGAFLRNEYGAIQVYKDSVQNLEVLVDNLFIVKVMKSPNNELIVNTSKIKTGMRTIKGDVEKFLNTLDNVQEEIKSQFPTSLFKEKEATVYLYLPYKDMFSKIYPPKNIVLKDYEILFSEDSYHSIIKVRLGLLEVYSKNGKNLEKIISKLI